VQYAPPGYGSDDNPVTAEVAWLLRLANEERTKYLGDIFSTVYFPVYDSFDASTRQSVAVMVRFDTQTGTAFKLHSNYAFETLRIM